MSDVEIEKETDWEEVHRILEELKDADVYTKLIALRGKVHLHYDIEALREDRD
jgi:hypothetical protein